jgi:2OG-Fe(II) oxygenase superfamily
MKHTTLLLFLFCKFGFLRGFLVPQASLLYRSTSHSKPFPRIVCNASSSTCSKADSKQTFNLDNAVINPPEILKELNMGETLKLESSPIELSRIAYVPDIFLVRNLVSNFDERKSLIDEATRSGMQASETKSGHVSHRKNSKVGWISAFEEGTEGQQVASYMADFISQVFLSKEAFLNGKCDIEKLQIVHYTEGGKFDIHHDGFNRIITALTYLNGVAGTWFPFAKVMKSNDDSDEDDMPQQMTLEGIGMTDGKTPGNDGVLIVGSELGVVDDFLIESNPHVIRVNAGDTVVFYNYEFVEQNGLPPTMAWRSLHAGLPAAKEKWIATNWIQSEILHPK